MKKKLPPPYYSLPLSNPSMVPCCCSMLPKVVWPPTHIRLFSYHSFLHWLVPATLAISSLNTSCSFLPWAFAYAVLSSAMLHFQSPPPFYLISVDLLFSSHLRPHFLRQTPSWSRAPLSYAPIELIPFFESMISICDYTVTSLINASSSISLWTP